MKREIEVTFKTDELSTVLLKLLCLKPLRGCAQPIGREKIGGQLQKAYCSFLKVDQYV